MSQSETVTLKLTSAIVLAGQIHRAGSLVEVSEPEARNLLDRGKAELATEKNVKAKAEPTEAELQALTLQNAAQEEKDAAALARVLKDEGMKAEEFEALSATKKKALLKQAHDAIAKDAAQ